MITKILTLFKIARKIAQSDVINIISEFHEVPKQSNSFFIFYHSLLQPQKN